MMWHNQHRVKLAEPILVCVSVKLGFGTVNVLNHYGRINRKNTVLFVAFKGTVN